MIIMLPQSSGQPFGSLYEMSDADEEIDMNKVCVRLHHINQKTSLQLSPKTVDARNFEAHSLMGMHKTDQNETFTRE